MWPSPSSSNQAAPQPLFRSQQAQAKEARGATTTTISTCGNIGQTAQTRTRPTIEIDAAAFQEVTLHHNYPGSDASSRHRLVPIATSAPLGNCATEATHPSRHSSSARTGPRIAEFQLEARRRRRINRLTKMLSHWRTNQDPPAGRSGEHSLRIGNDTQDAQISNQNFPRASSSNHLQLHEQPIPQPHFLRPQATHILISPRDSISASSLNDEVRLHAHNESAITAPGMGLVDHHQVAEPPRKLWQSLVLPIVLGCILLLVALWTRQISLAVTSDTILMIAILMGLFIIMSGVAFWLSCDRFLKPNGAEGATSDQRAAEDAHSPCRHCQHFHQDHRQLMLQQAIDGTGSCDDISSADHLHNNNNSNYRASNLDGALQRAPQQLNFGCQKCCGAISVIDCQPPDYYSAMINSMPVHHYLFFDKDDEELLDGQCQGKMGAGCGNDKDEEDQDASRGGGHDDDPRQLYLLPPSYDELHDANDKNN